jgi:hypothetical protein
MGGITSAFFGGGSGGGSFFTGTLTVGSGFIGGKGFSSTAYGYGNGSTYGTFGSIAPTAYRGFPIVAIYQADSSGTTVFEVSGDATAFTPAMTVDGVNQNLGAGSYTGAITVFQSSSAATDPFSGHASVTVAIS